MLPDFPKAKVLFLKHSRRQMKELARSQGILASLKEKPIFEGHRTTVRVSDESGANSDLKKLSENITFDLIQLIRSGPEYSLGLLLNAAAEIAKQQRKMLLELVESTSRAAGTSIDAKGKPLSIDLFLDTLRNIEIPFSDSGDPILPTMVSGNPAHNELVRSWQADQRFGELIAKKRKEWNDRESNRKLVE